MAQKEVEVEVKVEEEETLVTRKECLEQVNKTALDKNKSLVSTLMSDAEERLEITEEWARQVTKMLDLDNNSQPNEATLPRVATALMNVNPEAYIPRFISLGPYHHWKLKKDIASSARGTYQGHSLKISPAEEYKVKSAVRVAQTLRKHDESFNSIVKTIEGMRLDIERFYDWKVEDGQSCMNFALMMAVDSSFLFCFLFGLIGDQAQRTTAPSVPGQAQPAGAPSHDDMSNLSALQVCVKCDILKLENQILLFVLKPVSEKYVFEIGKDVLPDEHQRDFSYLLKKTYTVLSPFYAAKIDRFDPNQISNDAVEMKPHLLDCMQAIVSPFLQMKANVKDKQADQPPFQKAKHFLADIVPTVCGIFIPHPISRGHPDFLNAYNAEQLDKAGIKFKSFSDPHEHIRFDKESETLYLPRITVSNIYTEVFLRNMLALEFNDPGRRNSVTRYVGLMDCLIDTPKDVSLLRDSDIIRRPSLTDEYVAKLLDGICQPFFTGHLEPPEELKLTLQEVLIKKYYKSKIKGWLREFHGEYLSKPWKVISLFIGVCVLIITVLQGYCAFNECTHKSENSKRLGAMLSNPPRHS